MKPLYIFDLDGTLALIQHRRHFVERERGKQDWKGFYAACVNDEPNAPVLRVMESLRRFADVWIFSERKRALEFLKKLYPSSVVEDTDASVKDLLDYRGR